MSKDEVIYNIELTEKFNKVDLSGVKDTINHIDKTDDVKKLYNALNGSSKKAKDKNGKKVLKKYDGIETIIKKNVKDPDSRDGLLDVIKEYFFEKYYEAINGISLKDKYIEEKIAEKDELIANVNKMVQALIEKK